MKYFPRKLGPLAALAVAIAALSSPAVADPIISLSITPLSGNVAYGAPVGIDIIVSGLTQSIGGYAFDLNYDLSRLLVIGSVADPDTKMGDASNPAYIGDILASPGSLSFDVLAGFLEDADEPTLAALQGTGFRLAHVDLTALPVDGLAALTLSGFSLSDYIGNSIALTATNGAVCVSPNGDGGCSPTNVPEPTTAVLVATALGALALRRRQRPVA